MQIISQNPHKLYHKSPCMTAVCGCRGISFGGVTEGMPEMLSEGVPFAAPEIIVSGVPETP